MQRAQTRDSGVPEDSHPNSPQDPSHPPRRAVASRRRRPWLLALAIPVLALVSLVGEHDRPEYLLTRFLPGGPPAPMATQQRQPGYAWDSLAAGSDALGEGEPWAINHDVLHPVPGRKCPPMGDCVLDFPYHDEVLLLAHQGNAGRVWIPEEAREQGGDFPLLVLLHGIEPGDEPDPPHKLLSHPLDLSEIVRLHLDGHHLPPHLVSAPSQTRDAGGSSTLWTAEGFDLASFLEALDKELAETSQVRVRRSDVSVFGHSGAGCVLTSNKRNGLFRVAEQLPELGREGIHVHLLGFMDTCFYGATGGEFLAKHLEGTQTLLFAMWVEPEQWTGVDRGMDDFSHALGATLPLPCSTERYEECLGTPAGSRVYKAREEGLAPSPGAASGGSPTGLSPHDALPRWFVDEALGLYLGGDRPPAATPSAPAAPAPRRASSPYVGSGSPSPGG